MPSTQVLGIPTTLVTDEHNTYMEYHRATKNDGNRLFQRINLPPDFRSRYRFNRKRIPFGGFISIGNTAVTAPNFQHPQNLFPEKNRH
ncbi:hypothetical protein COEREDRAFT_82690 [Coemansia reversa NRRL 1564]|uniref:Uncharacterized protein n=1 Tax=Coemansia reversa (strain ATCC 12441 / NRRL 1564) TaxID=763665 RepID=A0A2G5B690_COERN|nr:hypothetical protein COEREDRAFT_82690 [Coemansia reversa NRRL 1564]|eukprot:PIA14563.1 hypothetical protein COEREDRAFT_82690 [Coemansia reversa NRRL 1564]